VQAFISISVRRGAVDFFSFGVHTIDRRGEPGRELLVRQRSRFIVRRFFGLGLGRPFYRRGLEAPLNSFSRSREASELFYRKNRWAFGPITGHDLAARQVVDGRRRAGGPPSRFAGAS